MGEKEDFKYCENIIKNSSKSFYKAFSKLPKDKSEAIYAVYAFCRIIDDIIDIKKDKKCLEKFERDFINFKDGKNIEEPMWRALRVVFNKYEMSYKPFQDMIKGQYMDLDFKQPSTQENLEEYCYYVAGTVGLMILPILSKTHKELEGVALDLGKAMQITNILRDIGEDYDNNRIYLPINLMKKHGYNEDNLARKIVDDDFISLWEYEASRAEELYQRVLNKIKLFDSDSILPVLLSLYFYREILFEVRENGYNCLKKRNYISGKKRIRLYMKSLIKYNVREIFEFIERIIKS